MCLSHTFVDILLLISTILCSTDLGFVVYRGERWKGKELKTEIVMELYQVF